MMRDKLLACRQVGIILFQRSKSKVGIIDTSYERIPIVQFLSGN